MEGRRYSDGLHQAIEAKERVKVEAATHEPSRKTGEKRKKTIDAIRIRRPASRGIKSETGEKNFGVGEETNRLVFRKNTGATVGGNRESGEFKGPSPRKTKRRLLRDSVADARRGRDPNRRRGRDRAEFHKTKHPKTPRKSTETMAARRSGDSPPEKFQFVFARKTT
jgi:hypothetical protein